MSRCFIPPDSSLFTACRQTRLSTGRFDDRSEFNTISSIKGFRPLFPPFFFLGREFLCEAQGVSSGIDGHPESRRIIAGRYGYQAVGKRDLPSRRRRGLGLIVFHPPARKPVYQGAVTGV